MPSRSLRKSLRQALNPSRESRLPAPSPAVRRLVVVGVGSRLRSDDAVGLEIAEKLGTLALPSVSCVLGENAPENVTGEIRSFRPTHVLFVDAADFGAQPGTTRLVEAEAIEGMTSSTHTLPLPVIADYLARETGCHVFFLGVQPKSLVFGGALSAEVEAARDEVVAAIADAVA